jgi:hypothetical protein
MWISKDRRTRVSSPIRNFTFGSIRIVLKDLGIKEAWIVAPVKESYPIEKNVFVANLGEFLAKFDRARQ